MSLAKGDGISRYTRDSRTTATVTGKLTARGSSRNEYNTRKQDNTPILRNIECAETRQSNGAPTIYVAAVSDANTLKQQIIKGRIGDNGKECIQMENADGSQIVRITYCRKSIVVNYTTSRIWLSRESMSSDHNLPDGKWCAPSSLIETDDRSAHETSFDGQLRVQQICTISLQIPTSDRGHCISIKEPAAWKIYISLTEMKDPTAPIDADFWSLQPVTEYDVFRMHEHTRECSKDCACGAWVRDYQCRAFWINSRTCAMNKLLSE